MKKITLNVSIIIVLLTRAGKGVWRGGKSVIAKMTPKKRIAKTAVKKASVLVSVMAALLGIGRKIFSGPKKRWLALFKRKSKKASKKSSKKASTKKGVTPAKKASPKKTAPAKKSSKRGGIILPKLAPDLSTAIFLILAIAGLIFGVYHWGHDSGYRLGVVENRQPGGQVVVVPVPSQPGSQQPIPTSVKLTIEKEGNYEFIITPPGAKILLDNQWVGGQQTIRLTTGQHSYWPSPEEANVAINPPY